MITVEADAENCRMANPIQFVVHTRGIPRGGLTPACGSAHPRNGRGFTKIDPTNAAALHRDASY